MATTKRRRRHARENAKWLLSHAQEQQLKWGMVLVPVGPEFESEEQQREAWAMHRDRLMASESGPGKRPYAYFKYDLGIANPPQPRHWDPQIRILVERGLIDEQEAVAIERLHPGLGPDENGQYRWAVEDRASAENAHEGFDLVSAWQRWRAGGSWPTKAASKVTQTTESA